MACMSIYAVYLKYIISIYILTWVSYLLNWDIVHAITHSKYPKKLLQIDKTKRGSFGRNWKQPLKIRLNAVKNTGPKLL